MSKTKNQTIPQYLRSLTKEYFQCELRSTIYITVKDKKYWSKVSKYKRQKITDICRKNGIDSIFTNSKLYEQYRQRFYPQGEECRLLETEQDYFYYYYPNGDIIYTGRGENEIAKLIDCDSNTKEAVIEIENTKERLTVPFREFRRFV